ncbi:MAG: GIY-YIG nuclease family protein [Fibrobacter sp.]|jgi:hypothetical protein|nr:GIY-YIG nuclease family protein [Fibrobacter sp.]
MNNLEKLKKIGFEHVGSWSICDNKLDPNLICAQNEKNVLYCFVIGNKIKYIGKTTQELKKRLYSYINPGPTQHTNINNNKKIVEELKVGKIIKILALTKTKPIMYKGIALNIAAGLEDNLIQLVKPEWNFLSK